MFLGLSLTGVAFRLLAGIDSATKKGTRISGQH